MGPSTYEINAKGSRGFGDLGNGSAHSSGDAEEPDAELHSDSRKSSTSNNQISCGQGSNFDESFSDLIRRNPRMAWN
eukprot:2253678-Pyramimonas_sp.AAC.1